jgi:hypothetical protein
MKAFSVKGKLTANPQPRFQLGQATLVPLQTHPVKMEDD